MGVEIPEKIGRYTVERMIGAGAMGCVYLGRDPELERPVAIKTVRTDTLAQTAFHAFQERFRNEARAAARLAHPSIVLVYDVGEDPQAGLFLVFEYVAGPTLKQIIDERGPLHPEEVLVLADQVGSAIDLAHSQGVIHRDIKPENILVAPNGVLKLADFGVARIDDAALTREGQFLGTPCYAAPESLARAEYSTATDLFSFTAVLFEAITGTRAFPGDSAVAVAHRVIHEDPPRPSAASSESRVPSSVDEVILRGLSKQPSSRFRTAEELARALRAVYVRAGIVQPAETQPRAEGSDGRLQRVTAMMFTGVLLGGLVFGIALVLALESPQTPDSEFAPEVSPLLQVPAEGQPVSSSGKQVAREQVDDHTQDTRDGLTKEHSSSSTVHDAGIELPPSAFAREEAAKDALQRARTSLSAGDLEGARQSLARVRVLDPNNTEIDELERAINASTR